MIPLRDEEGRLVGYAGWSLDGSEPKYLRHNLGEALQKEPTGAGVVVVEGFFSCMKVAEAGFPVVAVMGSSVSDWQTEKLYGSFRHVVLMFDGDDAGWKGTDEALVKLGRKGYVRAVLLDEDQAPDEMGSEEIKAVLRYRGK